MYGISAEILYKIIPEPIQIERQADSKTADAHATGNTTQHISRNVSSYLVMLVT